MGYWHFTIENVPWNIPLTFKPKKNIENQGQNYIEKATNALRSFTKLLNGWKCTPTIRFHFEVPASGMNVH